MKDNKILAFINESERATIPQIQLKFNLRYGEARRLVSKLEHDKMICLEEELYFKSTPKGSGMTEQKKPKSSASNSLEKNPKLMHIRRALQHKPSLYDNVLKFCVKNKNITLALLRRQFNISVFTANSILQWMMQMEIVASANGNNHKVLLTQKELDLILGNDSAQDDDDDDDEKDIFDLADIYFDEKKQGDKDDDDDYDKILSDFLRFVDDDDDDDDDEDYEALLKDIFDGEDDEAD